MDSLKSSRFFLEACECLHCSIFWLRRTPTLMQRAMGTAQSDERQGASALTNAKDRFRRFATVFGMCSIKHSGLKAAARHLRNTLPAH